MLCRRKAAGIWLYGKSALFYMCRRFRDAVENGKIQCEDYSLDAVIRCSSPAEVIAKTGFEADVSRAVILPDPNEDVLYTLRTRIDPEKIHLN